VLRDKKRIVVVTNSLTGGGAERSMNIVAQEFADRKFEVALIAINSGPRDLYTPTCKIFCLNRKLQGGMISTLFALIRYNLFIFAVRPNVIIVNTDLPELFGALTIFKSQIIAVEHSPFAWNKRRTFGFVVREVLKLRKSIFVSVSPHQEVWRANSNPIKVIPNPIGQLSSTEFLNHSVDPFPISRLIYIGRLTNPEKRPEIVLEIALATHLEVVFIGLGPERENLEILAQENEIKVNFLGFVLDPWGAIQDGDVLIVPSKWEGDGLVVLEALQRRIPILVSDIEAFRRFEFEEKNYCSATSDFCDKIMLNLVDSKELIVGNSISQSILMKRAAGVVGNLWEELLDDL